VDPKKKKKKKLLVPHEVIIYINRSSSMGHCEISWVCYCDLSVGTRVRKFYRRGPKQNIYIYWLLGFFFSFFFQLLVLKYNEKMNLKLCHILQLNV
jgi:hypothetical protein